MRKILFAWLLLLSSVCVNTTRAAEGAIAPGPELPKSTPWNLGELSKPPAFEWVDDKSPVRSLMYVGEAYQGKPTRVFAYYATPGTLAGDVSKDKNLPAVVLIHGGGGTAFREWAELWAKRGYAAISMDLAGARPHEGQNPHDPKNRTRLPDGGPGQDDTVKFFEIDKPVTEHWPYHAVGNAIRAHSLIRGFKEVDADRTAVTGISWGGYLTCIVASLDNRFKAAVPVYGCGFLHENSAWLGVFAQMKPEQKGKWVELYDPSRYLPACRVPIFFVNGTNDFAYPLDSYMKCYELVTHAPKNIRVTVNMPHSHPAGWEPREIGMFVDERLLGAEKLPVVESRRIGVDAWGFKSQTAKPASAALHYTTGAEPINKRNWKTVEAKVEGEGGLIPPLPPGATAWFITITDPRGATVSGPVVIVK